MTHSPVPLSREPNPGVPRETRNLSLSLCLRDLWSYRKSEPGLHVNPKRPSTHVFLPFLSSLRLLCTVLQCTLPLPLPSLPRTMDKHEPPLNTILCSFPLGQRPSAYVIGAASPEEPYVLSRPTMFILHALETLFSMGAARSHMNDRFLCVGTRAESSLFSH